MLSLYNNSLPNSLNPSVSIMFASVTKFPNIDNHHEFIPEGTQQITIPQTFIMKRGGVLPGVTIGYETWGELNSDKSNVILLFTGLSPNAHAASNKKDVKPGWWEPMLGSGKAIDTDKYYVICVNSLGSCFGSTGPASINPETKKAWRLDFPELSIEDIAHAAHLALQRMGITHINTVIGASMGGMTSLAYVLLFPNSVERMVIISTAAHSLPFSIAIRSLQREMICKDLDWMDGYYPFDRETLCGMRMARKLGMVSYRSAHEWEQRFGRERVPENKRKEKNPFTSEFQIESYLEYNANKFTGHFDANCYLYLSRAIDWFDAYEYGENLADAFSQNQLKRTLIIGVNTDILFPVHQQEEIATALKANNVDVEYHAFPSIQGHDAFLVDYDRFYPTVEKFLK